MTDPQPSDAVLGGQSPAPFNSAVLGGVELVKQLLNHPDVELRLEALDRALTYGDAGRVCLEQALSDRSKIVRRQARRLLRQPQSTGGLLPLPVWNLTERFARYAGYSNRHVTCFANREVREFQWRESSVDMQQFAYSSYGMQQFAYAMRCDYEDEENILSKYLEALAQEVRWERIEALVFGSWDWGDSVCTGDSSSKGLVELLVAQSNSLLNLKALFIGDITYEECEISWLMQSDMSPILAAYPKLEMLQVRGGQSLQFSTEAGVSRHESLKALVIETGGLSRETLQQICSWDLPALEHLELWFGTDDYGGDCQIKDLAPILRDLKFPNLTYLGLRNCKFANEMVDELVRSPILAGLQVLDLSLGTLSDEGAAKLLECPAIRDLETLNVSQSYLSGAMVDSLAALGIEVLADEQREEEEDEDPAYRRYCAVAE